MRYGREPAFLDSSIVHICWSQPFQALTVLGHPAVPFFGDKTLGILSGLCPGRDCSFFPPYSSKGCNGCTPVGNKRLESKRSEDIIRQASQNVRCRGCRTELSTLNPLPGSILV